MLLFKTIFKLKLFPVVCCYGWQGCMDMDWKLKKLGIYFAPLPCVCSAKSGTRTTGGYVTDVCHFHQLSGT